MTIAGVAIADDRAWAWADDEIFVDGEPAGRRNKLVINSVALLAAVSVGYVTVARAAEAAVADFLEFEDMLAELPAALRQPSAEMTALAARSPHPVSSATAIVGYRPKWNRIVCAVLDERLKFEPTVGLEFTSPRIECGRPKTAQEVVEIAQRQLAEFRRGTPLAGAGMLTVAEITAAGISIKRFELGVAALSATGEDGESPLTTPSAGGIDPRLQICDRQRSSVALTPGPDREPHQPPVHRLA